MLPMKHELRENWRSDSRINDVNKPLPILLPKRFG